MYLHVQDEVKMVFFCLWHFQWELLNFHSWYIPIYRCNLISEAVCSVYGGVGYSIPIVKVSKFVWRRQDSDHLDIWEYLLIIYLYNLELDK